VIDLSKKLRLLGGGADPMSGIVLTIQLDVRKYSGRTVVKVQKGY
jgi:hypothetical protein